jgi:hypothetical protein
MMVYTVCYSVDIVRVIKRFSKRWRDEWVELLVAEDYEWKGTWDA